MWYAITEYIWGSGEQPQTRSQSKIEEGWVLVQAENKEVNTKANIESESKVDKAPQRKSPKRKSLSRDLCYENGTKEISTKRQESIKRTVQRNVGVSVKGKDGVRYRKIETARKLKRKEIHNSFQTKRRVKQNIFQPRNTGTHH
ncbi:uncharacterized protein LOC130654591 [Hydractinia symbiolongicarpus]|uniref:uncharacterized protein LOC130654591 n=1 Tax=Hydractinia symbiolongicarpus TaxID=13093 RepID=UPI0025515CC9|nr:uncharacterized protein LOC130654591 [Hydractinia symbiolongicarpus]